MKERPILFSGPMVRAILQGRKTQMRRVVKPQPFMLLSAAEWHSRAMSGIDPYGCRPMGSHVLEEMGATCPHGIVGDRLWVREAWTPDHAAFYPNFPIVYRADRGYEYERNDRGEVYSPEQKAWYPYRWRPSIHMPRWASRLTLEITGVRVERLQQISDADVDAEGMDLDGEHSQWFNEGEHQHIAGAPMSGERYAFMRLWSSINGPESWSANPWVWVIEFKRLEAA